MTITIEQRRRATRERANRIRIAIEHPRQQYSTPQSRAAEYRSDCATALRVYRLHTMRNTFDPHPAIEQIVSDVMRQYPNFYSSYGAQIHYPDFQKSVADAGVIDFLQTFLDWAEALPIDQSESGEP